jgi:anti-sigma regulatory factor (Ser/Thr protein kinase)
MVQAESPFPPMVEGTAEAPTRPTSKPLSPFSTENLVYAAVVLHLSARFQHLWMTLLITGWSPLQKGHLYLRHSMPFTMSLRRKNRSFRGSCANRVVEKPRPPRYNGGELSARVEQPIPAQDRGRRHPMTSHRSSPSDSSEAPQTTRPPTPPEPAPGQGPAAETSVWAEDPPRIAVYADPHSPPVVVVVTDRPADGGHVSQLVDALSSQAHSLAREQGGRIPLSVFRELIDNLVHASFDGALITILDGGNTVRVSDRGPGIRDKEAALRPGFTSADARLKQFIRGVGSGFSVVKETLTSLNGVLEIEDNLGRGTVVTARVSPSTNIPLAHTPLPAYNLSERQLKTLLLTVELAPVGPTRVAQELGVSTSTAYRDLVFLEGVGFVASEQTGHRSATDAGLTFLDGVL